MEQYKKIECASILGMIGNIFLFIIKVVIGLFSNSYGMIADAMNSFGDIFSSIMTYVGGKIASKPRDDCHNLGHGKAEYIYSLLISIIIIIMIFCVLKSCIISLIDKNRYLFSFYLVLVALVTIFIKFCLYLYTIKLYKKYNNILLKANALDHRNDCFLTFLNLVSYMFAYNDIYMFDGIVGIIISFWLLIGAIKLFKESYDVLMDRSLSCEVVDRVYEIINKYDDVKKVVHFNSTPVGYKYQISFSIYVDGNLSTYESHDIANKLEKEITSSIDEIYLAVIHVNPI